LAIRGEGENTWSLIEGSDEVSTLIRTQFVSGASKMEFPARRLSVGGGDGSPPIESVERNGEFVPTAATRDRLSNLLESSRKNQQAPGAGKGLSRLRDTPHRDRTTGLRIRFPKGWTIKAGASEGTVVKAVNPDKSNSIELIAVTAYELGMTQDLRRLEPGSVVKAMGGKTPGMKVGVVKGGRTTLAGYPALWSVTTARFGTTVMHNLNFVFMRGETLFWIYGSSTDGGQAAFARYQELFRESIETCSFK
jgi:hypothetical protein